MNKSKLNLSAHSKNAILAILISTLLNFSLAYYYGKQPVDTSEFAAMKTLADGIKVGLIMIICSMLAFSLSGLIKKKRWGYVLALTSLILLVPIVMLTSVEIVLGTELARQTAYIFKVTFPLISIALLYLGRKDYPKK